MRNKTRIKLLTFFRTGKFNIIIGSTSKHWLEQNFVKPTDKTYMGHGLSIWRYDVIEFHFDGDRLFQIWCDNLDYLSSNRWIVIDKWILKHPARLNVNYVIKHLEQEHIAYDIDPLEENSLVLLLRESQVRLIFEGDKMIAFHLRFSGY